MKLFPSFLLATLLAIRPATSPAGDVEKQAGEPDPGPSPASESLPPKLLPGKSFPGKNFFKENLSEEWQTIRRNYLRRILTAPVENTDESKLTARLETLPQETEMSDQLVVELHQRYTPEKETVTRLIAGLQADGSWSDIDYADRKRSGWMPKNHADRILLLAKEFRRPGSAFYAQAETEKAIKRALHFWFERKLVCPNWWYNRIGIPKTLGPAFLLLEDRLDEKEKQEAIRVMKQADFGMTGQNKVWLAGNVFIRALLEHDPVLLRAARDTIASEIVTGREEGVRPDWSFHQHGPQQQFGNYGAAYLSGMAFWSTVFTGTSLAFSPRQLAVLRQFLMQGYARVVWKGYLDVNALGRQFFHNAQRHKGLTVAFAAAALMQSDPEHAAGYRAFIRSNFFSDHPVPAAEGLYHFRYSDLTVQRTPRWMASVKMSSERVIGGESGNGDNLQGYYLADGATYLYRTGGEYDNIYPCWDWRKLPGVTAYDATGLLPQLTWGSYRNGSRFVGNVNDGADGLTALDLRRDGLTARKAWIFTPEYVLCLGAAIASDSSCAVTTSVEQRLKRGEVWILDGNRWKRAGAETRRPIGPAGLRFFHDGNGYILWNEAPAASDTAVTAAGWRTGRWCDVMQMYRPDTVRQEVFGLHWNHGRAPRNGNYSYLLLPGARRNEVRNFPLRSIRILRNDEAAQAVSVDNGKRFFLAVYTATDIVLADGIGFSAETPGLYLLHRQNDTWRIAVSDPTQEAETASFRFHGRPFSVPLPQGEQKGAPAYLEIGSAPDK